MIWFDFVVFASDMIRNLSLNVSLFLAFPLRLKVFIVEGGVFYIKFCGLNMSLNTL